MIQDIAPLRLDNQYAHRRDIAPGATVFVFRGKDGLVSLQNGELILPEYTQLAPGMDEWVYLFSIGGVPCYLARLREDYPLPEGFAFDNVRTHRLLMPKAAVFAEFTAWHLYVWYRDNRFCGRCGTPVVHDGVERMLRCPSCGNMIFPKICPAIITGVLDGDRILLTKYAGRGYKNFALVAGFTEIGETAEETVAREVFEEAGLRVKNIRYWATQPWGIDCDLLLGYFCEVDGSREIRIDPGELAMAGWYRRDELDIPADHMSLTNDMIRAFIEGRENESGKNI